MKKTQRNILKSYTGNILLGVPEKGLLKICHQWVCRLECHLRSFKRGVAEVHVDLPGLEVPGHHEEWVLVVRQVLAGRVPGFQDLCPGE